MTPTRLRFARFKSSPLGRIVDTSLGLLLMGWGLSTSSLVGNLAIVVGVLAFLAGVLNVCWAAPILGIPFRGKDISKDR